MSKLQTIIFPKSHFTRSQAIRWLANNGYKFSNVDEKIHTYRFRQKNPIHGLEYYTIKLPNQVDLVYMR